MACGLAVLQHAAGLHIIPYKAWIAEVVLLFSVRIATVLHSFMLNKNNNNKSQFEVTEGTPCVVPGIVEL